MIFRRLMPLLIGAYIMAFLDRTNIGMAKDRLEIDLGISATAYGIGAGLFFLTYALSEIPSNLIMHKVGARFWIMRIMITWGIISAGMAFVQGEWSFYIMRMLLGVAEAGLFPGVMYFLTQWFVVKDRAKANGMFLLGVSIANIVGAPLGGLLLTFDGLGGLHGWQWMFIVEGLPGLRPGLRRLEEAPGPAQQATFLTAEEAADLEARIAAEETAGAAASGNHLLRDILKDKQILLVVGVYFTHQIAVYALSYFLPSIIGTYGKLSPLQIGLLTAIPWIFSAAGALLVPRFATDGRRSRMLVTGTMTGIVAGFALGAVGGPLLGHDRLLPRRLQFLRPAADPLHLPGHPAQRRRPRRRHRLRQHHRPLRRLPRPLRHGLHAGRHRLQALRPVVHRGHVRHRRAAVPAAQARHGEARDCSGRPLTHCSHRPFRTRPAARSERVRKPSHCKDYSWISPPSAFSSPPEPTASAWPSPASSGNSAPTVFVTDIDPDAVDKARVNGLLAAVSDVSDEGQVRELMDTVRDEMGGLDVLVNNAGIAGPTGPVESLDAAAWKATFDVNIHGQFFCIKHALPLLREGSGASIVNLSSAAGRLGMAGRSAYSASKWAVIGLTKTLAIELGPDGIRVNAICPGAVNGPRIDSVIAAKARMLELPADEVSALYHNQSSLGRLIEAEDIANMAAFVASDMARNVNGQALAVDGNTEKLY